MGIVFVASSLFLSILLCLRHFEHHHMQERYFAVMRARLDTATESLIQYVLRKWKKALTYIHRDIFLNGLHMLTYVALFTLRFAERKLERVAFFLRTFKKKENGNKKTTRLGLIVREKKEKKN